MFSDRSTYNTTQPKMLLNILHKGYCIDELLAQIN